MTDPKQHERYHIWFHRLARGIAFVAPGLLLLILLLTFITRMFGGSESSGDKTIPVDTPTAVRDELTTSGAIESHR